MRFTAVLHARRKRRIGGEEAAALGIVVLAACLRLVLVSQGWPQLSSDEGTMGLMALHIAYHGGHPTFLYGQAYMGPFEAYLGAVFFHLIGPSVFALRLGVMVLFVLFLVSMYLLTSLLYTKKLALLTLVLLSFGSSEMLFRQLTAEGGHAETLLFGATLVLVASWLALTSGENLSTHQVKGRSLAYGGFGSLVGLAIWSDFLVFPFVCMSCLLLALFCRKDMHTRGAVCLLLGLVVALLPLVLYTATVPLNQSPFAIYRLFFTRDASGHFMPQPLLRKKIAGTLLVSLPLATGGSTLCPLSPADAWPLYTQLKPLSVQTLRCTVVHGMWSVGYIALMTTGLFFAFWRYWKLGHRSHEQEGSCVQGQEARRQVCRLLLLGSAGLSLVMYMLSAPAAVVPWTSARYLVGLQIATPAALSSLWVSANVLKGRSKRVMNNLRYGVLILIGITLLVGTVATFGLIPLVQAHNREQNALVHDLLHLGARHIYSEYWTCDRIAFQSNEQIICSVLDEQLRPGLDRYVPYRAIINADPHAAYVFPMPSPQATAFASKGAQWHQHYQRFVLDGYVVYVPEAL